MSRLPFQAAVYSIILTNSLLTLYSTYCMAATVLTKGCNIFRVIALHIGFVEAHVSLAIIHVIDWDDNDSSVSLVHSLSNG